MCLGSLACDAARELGRRGVAFLFVREVEADDSLIGYTDYRSLVQQPAQGHLPSGLMLLRCGSSR